MMDKMSGYAVRMAQGIAFDSAEYGFIPRDFLKGHFLKGLSSRAPLFYPFPIVSVSPDTTSVEITGRLPSVFYTLEIVPLFYWACCPQKSKGKQVTDRWMKWIETR